MTKNKLIAKLIINFSESEGKKPTRKQVNEILNLLSMIVIEDPKAQVVLLENGIKFEKEFLKRCASPNRAASSFSQNSSLRSENEKESALIADAVSPTHSPKKTDIPVHHQEESPESIRDTDTTEQEPEE